MAKVKLVIRSFFILVIILLVVQVLLYLWILYNFNNGDSSYAIEIFKKNQANFMELNEDLFNLKNNYNDVKYLRMQYVGEWIFRVEDSIDSRNLDTKLEEKIKYIADQFEGVCMDKIIIYDNQISFSFEENTYSLVYRRDGTKPKFMNFKSELFSFKVKKISKKWYYCESK